jgi:hypothetical protein
LQYVVQVGDNEHGLRIAFRPDMIETTSTTTESPDQTADRFGALPVPNVQTVDEGIPWRWWGAAAGLATGLFDTATMAAFGVAFQMNQYDVTWFVGVYFGVSFAVL